VDEYVALELASPVRHEYHDGRVHAMSGASRAHDVIAGNIYMRLRTAARGGPCRVFMEGVRLALASGPQYYPDVMVACEPPADDPRIETAPCVVVEVLSTSTAGPDVGEKLPCYQAMPSVSAVVVVRQDARWVEVRRRHAPHGAFLVDYLIGQGAVAFPCPGTPGGPVTMTLDEIYAGAEPPPGAEIDAPDPEPHRQ
jgi:Uma2 family endonuclease